MKVSCAIPLFHTRCTASGCIEPTAREFSNRRYQTPEDARSG